MPGGNGGGRRIGPREGIGCRSRRGGCCGRVLMGVKEVRDALAVFFWPSFGIASARSRRVRVLDAGVGMGRGRERGGGSDVAGEGVSAVLVVSVVSVVSVMLVGGCERGRDVLGRVRGRV